MPKFLEECNKRNIYTNICTNGSPSNEWWESNTKKIGKISYSYHPQSTSIKTLYNHLNIITKSELQTNLFLLMIMHHDYFDENIKLAKDIISKFKYISIFLKPLVNVHDNTICTMYDYSKNQKNEMSKSYRSPYMLQEYIQDTDLVTLTYKNGNTEIVKRRKLIIEGMNTWKGWLCNKGIEVITIKFNGDLYSCSKKESPPFGNINDDIIELPREPTICNQGYCTCGPEISITKWKIY